MFEGRCVVAGLLVMAGVLLALLAGGAAPAGALTVDQVIALRRAGVSNQVIMQMIDTEIAVKHRGGLGRYVLKQKDGSSVIVYRAESPRGVVEYPVPSGGSGGVDRMGVVLGVERRAPAGGKAKTKARPKAKTAASAAGGYALHLASFRRAEAARRLVKKLAAEGLEAHVRQVELAGKGRWHRVLLGRYPSRDKARRAGEGLRRRGAIDWFEVLRQ